MDPSHRASTRLLSGPPPDPADPLVAALSARCCFPVADPLDLAVSGGPDSTAMLALAVAAGHHPVVHHVDHGLRHDAAEDAEAVAALGRSWGLEVVVHRVHVPPGGDLERRCREARLAVLPTPTLFGHTADDLAETVLLRILRGTGPGGLAAMSARNHPLLDLRRSETVELCDRLGLRPRRDPMNDDPRFTRNRVRAEVLPLLEDVAGRDVVPLICRLAQLAGEQEALMALLAEGIDATAVESLRAVPPPLAAEALRRWWRSETALLPPDQGAGERMLAVVEGRARSCDVVAGWRLQRRQGRLRLVPPG
jgi:tRNA(Ile)-lysidine synthase